MYPFEGFTEQSKAALTYAQAEAERAGRSYIGTEHLLLGLLLVEDGVAATVLPRLGVEISAVRAHIAAVVGRDEAVGVGQVQPTSRLTTVIEAAFVEAREAGSATVGTEHLLLGLLRDGEGIAAYVLDDLGGDAATVRAELARLAPPLGRSVSELEAEAASVTGVATEAESGAGGATAGRQQLSSAVAEIVARARAIAEARDATVSPEHLLLALTSGETPAAETLREHGLTSATVVQLLDDVERRPGDASPVEGRPGGDGSPHQS